MPVPGVCHEPFKPEKPSVTAYMLFSRGLLKLKRSRYAATGCRHKSMNVCSVTDPKDEDTTSSKRLSVTDLCVSGDEGFAGDVASLYADAQSPADDIVDTFSIAADSPRCTAVHKGRPQYKWYSVCFCV